VLAADTVAPDTSDAHFALATDDVMLLTTSTREHAWVWAERLDQALGDRGIRRSLDKDLTAVDGGTCIGVDLVGGRWWSPPPGKLQLLLLAILGLLDSLVASPRRVQALLGHASWLALLCRPLFAVFGAIYDHGRDGDLDSAVTLGSAAKAELWLYACLSPSLDFDLSREWQTCLVASDASPSWGFGVSVAAAPQDLVRAVGRFAVRHDVFVRLARGDGDPLEQPWKPRGGAPLGVPLARCAFKSVLSSRARFPGHAGALEAEGGVLAIRWLLRSVRRHARRTVLLMDARAVLGAFAKGRSSAPSLFRPARRLAAHVLAGELHVRFVYIPSEENPADDPSRGRRRCWRGRRSPLPARADREGLTAAAAGRDALRCERARVQEIDALDEELRARSDPDLNRYLDWLGEGYTVNRAFTDLDEPWRARARPLRRGPGHRRADREADAAAAAAAQRAVRDDTDALEQGLRAGNDPDLAMYLDWLDSDGG